MSRFTCNSCGEELGEIYLGSKSITGRYNYTCPKCNNDSCVQKCKNCGKYHSNIAPVFSFCDNCSKQKR